VKEPRISPRKRWGPGSPRLLAWAQDTMVVYESDTMIGLDHPLAHADFYKSGEVNIWLKSRLWIKDFMAEDEELTEEARDFFEQHRTGGYAQQMEDWFESKGWRSLESGNTYNLDSAYWWGDVFEYAKFRTKDGDEGATIMWHAGGDVRGGYELPRVYIGDFDEFHSSQYEGDPHGPETFLHWNRFFENDLVWALCVHGFFATPEGLAELPDLFMQALDLMPDDELVAMVGEIGMECDKWDPGWGRYTAILRREAERRMGQRHLWPGLYERP
jgi:hypothetical protein